MSVGQAGLSLSPYPWLEYVSVLDSCKGSCPHKGQKHCVFAVVWTVVKGQTFQVRESRLSRFVGPDFPGWWSDVRVPVHLNMTKTQRACGVLDSCKGSCQHKGHKHCAFAVVWTVVRPRSTLKWSGQ